MIDSFAFGKMVIQGRTYTTDLMICPDGRVIDDWWRKKGHRLSMADLTTLLKTDLDTLIVGTGVNGLMKPVHGLEAALKDRGIRMKAAANPHAVQWFNDMHARGRVGACFHLSC